ncbi:class F sortase [Streptomyces tateyamensis]|uniref:Class F sortase n=1 Tax=Streptomyces tateyamensis TaxID=565073 RepID=A0A2V4NMT5_9ACTN|nr:sortase [Streptomyces tateyamensis]PYC77240.1 class F sortase [Streptomyces tateyamensis]
MVSPVPPTEARPPRTPGPSRRTQAVLFSVLGAALTALLLVHQSEQPRSALPPRPPDPAQAQAAASPTGKRTTPAVQVPDAHPSRLKIAALSVDAPFTGLDKDAQPPADDPNLVGWFQGGTVPGNRGPAVLVGRPATTTAPAVFTALGTLAPATTVDVARDDGVTATFAVDSVETFAQGALPADRIYGPTADAQLRLITCGGAYDAQRGDYTASVVVFAHLTGLRET